MWSVLTTKWVIENSLQSFQLLVCQLLKGENKRQN